MKQRLAEHALQDEGKLSPDLRLLIGREYVEYSVDRLHTAVGVEGGKTNVPGFGDHQRGLDRLQVSHFSHQHHVRVLAENVFQGHLEASRIGADLPLIHHAVLVRMQIFDRIFNGHDVLAVFGIDLVDDRRQRGGFAGAGGAGDEDQSPRPLGEFHHRRRQPQLLEAENLEGNGSKRRSHRAALHEDVGTKARQILDSK